MLKIDSKWRQNVSHHWILGTLYNAVLAIVSSFGGEMICVYESQKRSGENVRNTRKVRKFLERKKWEPWEQSQCRNRSRSSGYSVGRGLTHDEHFILLKHVWVQKYLSVIIEGRRHSYLNHPITLEIKGNHKGNFDRITNCQGKTKVSSGQAIVREFWKSMGILAN